MMTLQEAIDVLKHPNEEYHGSDGTSGYTFYPNRKNFEAFQLAIKALEQKPYEKFESTKDHICKLAGDYKCWDNRLTQDEALELCHILEQEPILDKITEDIQTLRGCSCWYSDGIIDDVEDIIDKYRTESEG